MSLAHGLVSQFEVVHALALRETRTRFGAHQLGYLWALLEPSLLIGTFILVFTLAKRPAPEGMDLYGFTATGIIPYLVFINSVNRVAEAINGNKALLFYPHVQPLDLVMARAALELATYGGIFLILMGGHALYVQELAVDEPLLVVAGWILAGLLGMTLGLVFCGLAQYSKLAERIRGPLLRPMFWICGVFFTGNQLPDGAREALFSNPLLHATELIRDGWYREYTSESASVSYLVACILGLAFIGLALERTVRRRIDLT